MKLKNYLKRLQSCVLMQISRFFLHGSITLIYFPVFCLKLNPVEFSKFFSSFSVEEAARYLETYKAFENKGPELLLGNDLSAATDLLTAVCSLTS